MALNLMCSPGASDNDCYLGLRRLVAAFNRNRSLRIWSTRILLPDLIFLTIGMPFAKLHYKPVTPAAVTNNNSTNTHMKNKFIYALLPVTTVVLALSDGDNGSSSKETRLCHPSRCVRSQDLTFSGFDAS